MAGTSMRMERRRPRSRSGPSGNADGKRRRNWSIIWTKPATKTDTPQSTDPETGTAGSEDVDGGDVAAIRNDDRLTAADRVDRIANQVIPEQDDNTTQHPRGTL